MQTAVLLAQVEKVFNETANTWGLAVGILIAILVAVFFGAVAIIRWMKPLAERIIASHLQTMETFRTTSITMADSQVKIQVKIEQIMETDMEIKQTMDRHSDAVRLNSFKLDDNTKELKGNTEAIKGACRYVPLPHQ